jgi:hypothetical protein
MVSVCEKKNTVSIVKKHSTLLKNIIASNGIIFWHYAIAFNPSRILTPPYRCLPFLLCCCYRYYCHTTNFFKKHFLYRKYSIDLSVCPRIILLLVLIANRKHIVLFYKSHLQSQMLIFLHVLFSPLSAYFTM